MPTRSQFNPVQVSGRSPEEIKAYEETKRKEEVEKKKLPIKKEKKHFDIRLEAMAPVILTYRILADDEQDALLQMDKKTPTSIKPIILRKKNIKATVYDAGSSLIKFVKAFRV